MKGIEGERVGVVRADDGALLANATREIFDAVGGATVTNCAGHLRQKHIDRHDIYQILQQNTQ